MFSLNALRQKGQAATLTEEFRRCLSVIFDSLCAHTPHSCEAGHFLFTQDVRYLARQIVEEDLEPGQAQAKTELVAERYRMYALEVEQEIRAAETELHLMVQTLTQALSQAGELREKSIAGLASIARQAQKTTEGNEIRALRIRLEDGLKEALKPTRTASPDIRGPLPAAKDAEAEEPLGDNPEPDYGTGLPTRTAAVEAMVRASADQTQPVFVAIFKMLSLEAVGQRFGARVGAECLLRGKEIAAGVVQPGDELFLWGRGNFLAVMRRNSKAELVKRDIDRSLSNKTDFNVSVSGRNVLLKLSISTQVAPIWEGSSPIRLSADIDSLYEAVTR